jgi:hypothetical protein
LELGLRSQDPIDDVYNATSTIYSQYPTAHL